MKSKGTSRLAATFIERLIQSLEQAARHPPGDSVPPAAVLWTDADGQWKALVEPLLARLPHFFVHGGYDKARRTGPAIWLKCVIARSLDEPRIPDDVVPVIYLPGVGRQELRAGEECPEELQPLIELQYRGLVWTQRNGKDWTVEAFLGSDDGLGLDLAKDSATRHSLQQALRALAGVPVTQLLGRHLEAEDFDKLLVGDQPRDLLTWMSAPAATRGAWEDARWKAFRSRCQAKFQFDPEMDGETAAGERLGLRKGSGWSALWDRYVEAPDAYPGIPELLVRCRPSGELSFDKSTWPDENERAEASLRDAFAKMQDSDAAEARGRTLALEEEHGLRRQWVWARLGKSTLAQALEHLAVLARRTASLPGGETPDEMARSYGEGAYLADDAALKSWAAVRTGADSDAVRSAIRALYLPWLDDSARRFQDAVKRHPLPARGVLSVVEAAPGECILFADGLRFDLAQRLCAMLEAREMKVSRQQRWAALPTVTATGKPAASPVATRIVGRKIPETFSPEIAGAGQPLTTDRFRDLLGREGVQWIPSGEAGSPGQSDARGWTEAGQIDKWGHKMEARLAAAVDEELEGLCERIAGLLVAGWRSVRVVTDHGWLLLPGGLPRHDLPNYLAESKWARCAAIKGASRVQVPTAQWHWNPTEVYATAPGVACFSAGLEYAHGGLSLQECLLPDLRIVPAAEAIQARIVEIQWVGMRCRIRVEPMDTRLRVDLRTKANDPASSMAAAPKPLEEGGRTSLVVEDDGKAGTAVVAVVLDTTGRVLTKHPTTVGGKE
ncbi:MAG: BREX-1 system phosphatase PglZ type B [Planctomycetes bacterium]|nr:BREX-1 system phosphatase PglZ type B [Planctomycetota bacterium]